MLSMIAGLSPQAMGLTPSTGLLFNNRTVYPQHLSDSCLSDFRKK